MKTNKVNTKALKESQKLKKKILKTNKIVKK